LKPLAAVKLPVWKCVAARATIASTGTATFHQVAALFVRASLRTPRKLMAVKTAMSPMATSRPVAVSTCCPPWSFSQPEANE
jgi:hypothetical protein